MSKYRNKKCEYNGIKFDSKREQNRYLELLLMKKAGLISDLILQPVFILQPKFKKNGKTIRAIKYIADFQYTESGRTIVEDVKGYRNVKTYLLKKKMFEYKYPDLTIIEI